eukprot:GEMP01002398.1.p1 GENE.GEMP01002398.1~~GEMP01002398.1.p1  ORF type:complete len:1082 (+),score=222.41 GEMP01002398.1:12-3257(+)
MSEGSGSISRVPTPLPPEISERYENPEILGHGAFAVVLSVEDKTTRKRVACKALETEAHAVRQLLDQLHMELETAKWAGEQHHNIVEIMETIRTSEFSFLIMELMRTNLLEFIQKLPDHRVHERISGRWMHQAASALVFLHENLIVHRDVKLENLLYEPSSDDEFHGVVKLTDFGWCAKLDSNGQCGSTMCGTPSYNAPEIQAGVPQTKLVDAYSLGVCSFITSTGQQYVSGTDENAPRPHHFPLQPSSIELLNRLLEEIPVQRLSLSDAISMPFFNPPDVPETPRRIHTSCGRQSQVPLFAHARPSAPLVMTTDARRRHMSKIDIPMRQSERCSPRDAARFLSPIRCLSPQRVTRAPLGTFGARAQSPPPSSYRAQSPSLMARAPLRNNLGVLQAPQHAKPVLSSLNNSTRQMGIQVDSTAPCTRSRGVALPLANKPFLLPAGPTRVNFLTSEHSRSCSSIVIERDVGCGEDDDEKECISGSGTYNDSSSSHSVQSIATIPVRRVVQRSDSSDSDSEDDSDDDSEYDSDDDSDEEDASSLSAVTDGSTGAPAPVENRPSSSYPPPLMSMRIASPPPSIRCLQSRVTALRFMSPTPHTAHGALSPLNRAPLAFARPDGSEQASGAQLSSSGHAPGGSDDAPTPSNVQVQSPHMVLCPRPVYATRGGVTAVPEYLRRASPSLEQQFFRRSGGLRSPPLEHSIRGARSPTLDGMRSLRSPPLDGMRSMRSPPLDSIRSLRSPPLATLRGMRPPPMEQQMFGSCVRSPPSLDTTPRSICRSPPLEYTNLDISMPSIDREQAAEQQRPTAAGLAQQQAYRLSLQYDSSSIPDTRGPSSGQDMSQKLPPVAQLDRFIPTPVSRHPIPVRRTTSYHGHNAGGARMSAKAFYPSVPHRPVAGIKSQIRPQQFQTLTPNVPDARDCLYHSFSTTSLPVEPQPSASPPPTRMTFVAGGGGELANFHTPPIGAASQPPNLKSSSCSPLPPRMAGSCARRSVPHSLIGQRERAADGSTEVIGEFEQIQLDIRHRALRSATWDGDDATFAPANFMPEGRTRNLVELAKFTRMDAIGQVAQKKHIGSTLVAAGE